MAGITLRSKNVALAERAFVPESLEGQSGLLLGLEPRVVVFLDDQLRHLSSQARTFFQEASNAHLGRGYAQIPAPAVEMRLVADLQQVNHDSLELSCQGTSSCLPKLSISSATCSKSTSSSRPARISSAVCSAHPAKSAS